MTGCANLSYSISGILDLPLELFQRIIREAILARGIVRGIRLRLVSRLFSEQVRHVLFIYRMLDASLSLRPKLPSFTASYLEYRVNTEPECGNPMLLCIRQVAERLTPGEQATRHCIASLCALAAPNARRIFLTNQPPWKPIGQEEMDEHVKAAEIFMNHISEVATWAPQHQGSSLFGGYFSLAVQYGSREMIELHLKGRSYISDRCSIVRHAARFGRVDMFRFSFNYNIESVPWQSGRDPGARDALKTLAMALNTPEPEIWDYVTQLHKQYGLPISAKQHTNLLSRSAECGWTRMARHLLHLGTDPNGAPSVYTGSPILYAAQKGHLGVVKVLLAHNAETAGAVVVAAKGGYGDIVELLLESGASANEEDEELPAICYAVLAEHTRMLRCLLEHGAEFPAWKHREECARRAKARGVESMFALLEPLHCALRNHKNLKAVIRNPGSWIRDQHPKRKDRRLQGLG